MRDRRRTWFQARLALLAATLCTGCSGAEGTAPEAPAFSHRAVSSRGMVVTGSPYATEAGVRVLEAGGNAIDAAVAAAFALAVAEPTQSGLGGRTQILLRTASGAVHAVDGGTEVPAGYDAQTAPAGETGYAAVGIPGTVAALLKVHEEHGVLGRVEVLGPAVAWAEDGVRLPDGERRRLEGLAREEGPESAVARLFGTEPDSVVVQPQLARTLRAIVTDGHHGFYGGEVAAAMARDIGEGGGFVSASDLAAYRPRDGLVGRTSVGEVEVVGSYLPASGVTVAEIMGILDRVDVPREDGAWADLLADALVAGFEDREMAESMSPAAAVAWLMSDSLLERRAREVMTAMADPPPTATSVGVGEWTRVEDEPLEPEPPFTSHISVADVDGNLVAMTQSLGPSGGARVATPELGFLYASTLGGYLTAGGPGYRPWSSQAPLLVLGEEGPVMVAGGAGARRIISALVGTLSRTLHLGVELEEALRAPRLHPTGGRVYVEAGWGVAAALEERGQEAVPRERSYFARLNVIEIDRGRWTGIAEPGWSGASAAGPR
ncbi:MAG: gamma-glutamyltransferase [Gemmatimonadetes bacterium]|nr:gamma-glutamyltransferase [Gemmatimonadota bacterium]